MCGSIAHVNRLYRVGASLVCFVYDRIRHSTTPQKRNFAGVSFTARYYLLLVSIILKQMCVKLAFLVD
jgi:hypothetical protein